MPGVRASDGPRANREGGVTVIARKALTIVALVTAEVVLIAVGVAYASTPVLIGALAVSVLVAVAAAPKRRRS